MDVGDIRTIIGFQLMEIGITPTQTHYDIATDYYNQNSSLPDMDFIINKIIEINLNNEHNLPPGNIGPAGNVHIAFVPHGEENDTIVSSSSDEDSENEELINIQSDNYLNDTEILNIINDALDVKKVLVDINTIPLSIINEPLDEYCSTCYDQLVLKDLVRVLPCKHKFHRRCIDNYLTTESYLCPLCRNPAGDHQFTNI